MKMKEIMVSGIPLANRRWDWDFFMKVRQEVLGQWPTGAELLGEAGLREAVAYQTAQPRWKFASLRNADAEQEGRTQVVGQVGHALVEQVIAQIQYSEDLKPDRWYVLEDTYTRKGQFSKAQEAVERSRKEGRSYLNGYPPVIHGMCAARTINEASQAVLMADGCDEDPRLQWELTLAGGWTAGPVHPLNTTFQHSRDEPLERAIFNFQYMDRLIAHYTEHGAPILAITSANLSGWDPQGIKVAVNLIHCLLAAEQGVKHLDLELGLSMHLVQDVASIHVVRKLAREYLDRRGYTDTKLYPWIYFYLGDWPQDRDALGAQLAWNAAIATLAGCNGMIVKSTDEASSTPTKEGFRAGIKIAKQIVRLVGGQRLPEGPDLAQEKRMLELEARAILDRTLELGDGDVAVGACRAVEAGIIDVQFSPWRRIKGDVLSVRDAEGAFRYLDAGSVPLPPEVREYHRMKLAQREAKEGTKADLDWVIREATWASSPLQELQA
jgi:methylaspartate mutase epsilon subunit